MAGAFDDLVPQQAPVKSTGAFDDLVPKVAAPKPAGAFDDLIPGAADVPTLDQPELGYVTRDPVTPPPKMAPVTPIVPASRFTKPYDASVGISSAGEPETPLDAAMQKFPALQAHRANMTFSTAPDPGNGNQLESFPPWESQNPNPGKFTTQLYRTDLPPDQQANLVAGDALHYMGAKNPETGEVVDPGFRKLKEQFIASLTPEQRQHAQERFAQEQSGPDGYKGSFDQWLDSSHVDEYLMGALTPDKSDEWRGRPGTHLQNQYTPQQDVILDQMRQYLGRPPQPVAGANSPRGDTGFMGGKPQQDSPFLNEVMVNSRKGYISPAATQQIVDAWTRAHQEGQQIDPRSVGGRAALDAFDEITNGGDLQATLERYLIGGAPLNSVKDRIAEIQRILDNRAGIAGPPTERQATAKEGFAVEHILDSKSSADLLALQRHLEGQLPALTGDRGNMLLNLAKIAGKWEGMPDPQGIAAHLAAGVGHVVGQAPSPENIVGAGAAPARAAFTRLAGETIAQMAKRLGIDLGKAAAIDAATNAGVAAATDPIQQAAAINEGRQPAYDPLQSVANIGGAAAFGAAFGAAGRAAGWTADAWKAWRARSAEDIMRDFGSRGGAGTPPPGAGGPPPPGGSGTAGAAGAAAGAKPGAGAAPPPKADYSKPEWAGKFGSTATEGADRNFTVDASGYVVSDKGGPIRFDTAKEAGQWAAKQNQRKDAAGNELGDQLFGIDTHPGPMVYSASGRSGKAAYTVKETMRRPKEEPASASGPSSEEAKSNATPGGESSNAGEKVNTGEEAPNSAAGEPPVYGPLGGVGAEEAKTGANEAESGPMPGTRENPARPQTKEEMDAAAANAAESDLNNKPGATDGQKAEGNYEKAHVIFAPRDKDGPQIPISIENPKGSTRSGTSPDGTAWSNVMPAHYGHLKRSTMGADGDQLDVFVGDNPKSEKVWVIDQVDPKTGAFDETKSMMGMDSAMQAIDAYSKSYGADGESRIGAITPMSIDQFDAWRKSDASKGQASQVDFAKPEAQDAASATGGAPEAEQSQSSEQASGASIEGVSSVPASQVGVDAKKFQFKGGGDEAGVTEALRGVRKWEPEKADIVTLFKDKDGKLWVADGHQRVGLAQRLEAGGHPPINLLARTYDSKEGYTPGDVMLIAAVKNIVQGSGTPLDAAKVIRRLGIGSEVVKDLPPKSALVRDGQDLAKLGDEAFQQAAQELVPWNVAALVGREITGDKQQLAALDILRKADVSSVQEAQAVIDQIKAQGFEETINQGGLFGDEEVAKSLVLERAKVLSAAMTELRRNRALFNKLIKGADIAQAVGNKLDAAANQEEKAKYEALAAAISRLANSKGEISDALTAAAKAHQGGKRAAAAAQDFIAVVSRLPDGWARGSGPGAGASAAAEAGRAFFTPERIKALDTAVRATIAKWGPELARRREGQPEAASGAVPAHAGDRALGDAAARRAGADEGASPTVAESGKSRKAGNDVGPLLPGFEPSTKEQLAAKGAAKKPEQKPMDIGLFGEGHKQMDIEPGKGAEVIPPWTPETRALASKGGLWVDGGEDIRHLAASMGVKDGDPAGMARVARRWVTERGRAIGVENLVGVDAAGHLVEAGTINQPGMVGIGEDLASAMNLDGQITIHHNHPTSGSLSAPDLAFLLSQGIRRIVAYGTDGKSVYAAERGRNIEKLFSIRNPVGKNAVVNLHGIHDHVWEAAGQMIDRHFPEILSVPATINLVHAHAINLVLEKLGLITYFHSGASVDMIHATAEKVANAVFEGLPLDQLKSAFGAAEIDRALSDRSAGPVRDAEAMGRISGPAQDHAPGRSAGLGVASPREPAPQHGSDARREAGAPETIAEQPAAPEDKWGPTPHDENGRPYLRVIDRQTGKEHGRYLNQTRARNVVDKLDNEYGGYRYFIPMGDRMAYLPTKKPKAELTPEQVHLKSLMKKLHTKENRRDELRQNLEESKRAGTDTYWDQNAIDNLDDQIAALHMEIADAGGPAVPDMAITAAEASKPYFNMGPTVPPRAAKAMLAGQIDFLDHINRPGFPARLERANHAFIRMVADDNIRGMQVQNFIEKNTGVPIPDQNNFYLHAQAAVGIKAERLQQGLIKFEKPIYNHLRASKHDLHWAEKGLYALAAPDRNSKIAKREPTLPDGGSGLTTAAAQAYLAGLSPADRAELDRLDVLVQRLRREDLSNRVDAGLMSPTDATQLMRDEPHYVSLQGREDLEGDEEFVHAGAGFSVKGQEFKPALGRVTEPKNILAHTIAQYRTSILRAENNKVGQTLANLATAHPAPDFWHVDKVKYTKVLDKATGLVKKVYSADSDPEHTIYYKINGNPHRIWIADHKWVGALKNKRASDILRVLRVFGIPLNIWRHLATIWSPEFLVGNAPRDFQDGMIQGTALGGKKVPLRIIKNYVPSVVGAAMGAHGFDKGWAKWMRRAAAAGAISGNFEPLNIGHHVANLENLTSNKFTKKTRRVVGKGLGAVFNEIERANTAIEAGMRVAVFRACVESGMSDLHAANVAKNATVNFDRKGTLGPYWSPVYAFFQAAINGNFGLLRIIKKAPKFLGAVGTGLLLAGAGEALWWEYLRNYGTPEQKAQAESYEMAPEWVQERNLMIPALHPKDAPWAQAQLGFTVVALPYNTGRQIMNRLLGRIDTNQFLSRLLHHALTSALPVDPSNGASGIAPTLFRPAFEVGQNKAWTGRPIYPDKHGKSIPNSQNFYPSVSPFWKHVADNLNRWTGGDDVKPGGIDISPNTLEYVWQQYTASTGQLVDRLATDYQKKQRGEDLDWNEIPIARRFIGNTTASVFRDQFYTVFDQLKTLDEQRDQYQKKLNEAKVGAERDGAKADQKVFQAKNDAALKFWDTTFKAAKSQIDNRRAELKQIDANKSLTDDQKKAKRKDKNDKILGIAKATIERYNTQVLAPQQKQRALIHVTPNGIGLGGQ